AAYEVFTLLEFRRVLFRSLPRFSCVFLGLRPNSLFSPAAYNNIAKAIKSQEPNLNPSPSFTGKIHRNSLLLSPARPAPGPPRSKKSITRLTQAVSFHRLFLHFRLLDIRRSLC